jgi:hypothetical protein
MSLKVPDQVAEKSITFPESSYGACIATLVLRDGRRIKMLPLPGTLKLSNLKVGIFTMLLI